MIIAGSTFSNSACVFKLNEILVHYNMCRNCISHILCRTKEFVSNAVHVRELLIGAFKGVPYFHVSLHFVYQEMFLNYKKFIYTTFQKYRYIAAYQW